MRAVRAVMEGIDQQREGLSRVFADIADWRRSGDDADLSPVSAEKDE